MARNADAITAEVSVDPEEPRAAARPRATASRRAVAADLLGSRRSLGHVIGWSNPRAIDRMARAMGAAILG